ncbi:MAG: hypothetical protein E7232_02050 [Lachnospiraceae bacterium]|nr:hypothetical protein [Lachnospiraceae bacterium]
MIVLTILKVIGIVLLVILLLILLLLSILLFVPVRYRSLGYKREESKDYYVDFHATWLMKALRFKAEFDPGGLKMNLKFLFITLMDSSGDEENESESDDREDDISLSDDFSKDDNISKGADPSKDDGIYQDDNISKGAALSKDDDLSTNDDLSDLEKADARSDESEISNAVETKSPETETPVGEAPKDTAGDRVIGTDRFTAAATDVKSDSIVSEVSESSEINKTETDSDSDSNPDIISETSSKEESYASDETDTASSDESGPDFTEKTEKKFRRILDKIKEVSRKTTEIKAAVTDEENRAAVKLIIKNLKYLLRHYRFRSLNGNLSYGSEDPSSVGTVMMYLGMLYPVYGENFTIEPVFDRSVLTGDMRFKGRIRLIHLLVALIELMLNKKIRQFVINRL